MMGTQTNAWAGHPATGETMTDHHHAIRFSETFRAAKIALEALPMGRDIAISVSGGERPHIGAVAVAQPRPSLADPQKVSATTSVIALLGHKEDMLARGLAARVAAAIDGVAVVSCGIHYDGLSDDEIAAVSAIVGRLADRLLEVLGRPGLS